MKFISIYKAIKNNLVTDESHCFRSLNLLAKYYKEYYKENFTDLSFFIMNENIILGYVICCVLNKKLTLPEGCVIVCFFDDRSKTNKFLCASLLSHIESLAKQYECEAIIIKDLLEHGSLTILGERLFNNKYKSNLTFEMEISYKDFMADNFHKSLRKSYKSLVNWGKNNLEVLYINRDNHSLKTFRTFQDFHFKIAGRKTRSDETWQAQYDILRQGMGELALAYYQGNLVAGSLFADYGDTTVYFTGVYERDLFDFGVSHFLLYDGILRSYERGNTTRFSLGYFDTDIQDPKWYNIQFFKKGFCERLTPTVLWSKGS